MKIILIFIFAYALIYPLINFSKKERHISGSLAENRSTIEKAMEEMDYVKKVDNGPVLLYRKKSTFTRIMMFGEDRVEIDTTANPLIIRGPKKDLKRIDSMLDSKLLRENR